MDDNTGERFLQFPLFALNFHDVEHERMHALLMFCCLDSGRKRCAEMSVDDQKNEACEYVGKLELGGFNQASAKQRHLIIGAKLLNVTMSGGMGARVDSGEAVERHCYAQPTPLVRLAIRFFWDCYTAHTMTFRELAVLSAIYSKIGAKAYCKMSAPEVQCRATGFSTRPALEAAVKEGRTFCLYTNKQIRTTIETLLANRYLAKFTYNRGETFYSHRVESAAELGEKILRKKTWKHTGRAEQAKMEREISDRIKAAKLSDRPQEQQPPLTK